jgi:hypothetical protein
MSDEEIDVGSEMVSEEGTLPGINVEEDQRAELLRRWHREDAENEKKKGD